MKLNQKDHIKYSLLYTPLIGKNVEIIQSINTSYVGIKGLLVKESAQFIVLLVDSVEKKYKKSLITLKVEFENENFSLDCTLLEGTLATRLKKLK